MDIGEYDPLSGLSYSELGADSRSQHRSQAFGVTWRRGTSKEYLEFVKGDSLKSGLFEGIDITWNRVKRKDIASDVSEILKKYDFRLPAKSVQDLIDLRRKIQDLDNEFWKEKKIKEVDDIILACAGLYMEATSGRSYVSPEDTMDIQLEITNRSNINIAVIGVLSQTLAFDTLMNTELENNIPFNLNISKRLIDEVRETSPYWLDEPVKNFKYEISDQSLKGLAQNPVSIEFIIKLNINNEVISYSVPVV